jgi:hypothetical protein
MKKQAIIILLIALSVSCSNPLHAQFPDSVKTYIESAIYIMQSKALNGKDRVVRPDVYAKSEDNYDDLSSDPTVKRL